MEHPLLKIDQVSVCYPGRIKALDAVSMAVGKGQIVSLLGGNGAGKTTLLKTVSGMLSLTEGRVEQGSIAFEGERLGNLAPALLARKGIIHVLEGRQAFGNLTVEENLRVGTAAGRTRSYRKGLELAYHYFPALLARRKTPAKGCSNAEIQMMVIGRALMAQPRLLLLDEPSRGLAPLAEMENFAAIQKINEEQRIAMLLAEQKTSLVLQVCRYGYLMLNGSVLLEGDAETLRNNPELKGFYLGMPPLEVFSYLDGSGLERTE